VILRVVPGTAGLVVAGALALPVLLVSFRLFRVFGPGELGALGASPVPFIARAARFLGPER
jgi:hypothetical protein